MIEYAGCAGILVCAPGRVCRKVLGFLIKLKQSCFKHLLLVVKLGKPHMVGRRLAGHFFLELDKPCFNLCGLLGAQPDPALIFAMFRLLLFCRKEFLF